MPEDLCSLCPRHCRADRFHGTGFCGVPESFLIARAAPHFGEEPCLCGTAGSGAVFFCGCNLRCVFCQNHVISRGSGGLPVSDEELKAILLRLQDQGVHNIDLVTPSHYSHRLAGVLRDLNLSVPVIWNSSGYETVEQLRELEGLVQVYMPDFKFADPALAGALSLAPDYPKRADAAIREMLRQTGPPQFDAQGLLVKGVLIRHLILPGHIENTLRVIDHLEDHFPKDSFVFSLLSQYTPPKELVHSGAFRDHPELSRTLLPKEFERVEDYLFFSDIENGYLQEPDSAGEEYVPSFDGTGIR